MKEVNIHIHHPNICPWRDLNPQPLDLQSGPLSGRQNY